MTGPDAPSDDLGPTLASHPGLKIGRGWMRKRLPEVAVRPDDQRPVDELRVDLSVSEMLKEGHRRITAGWR